MISSGAQQTITGGGSFTQGNINAINSNFTALQDIDLWVRPQYGTSNGNGSTKFPLGSYDNPYSTMAALTSRIVPGIVIGLQGVLQEYWSPPNVADVTIRGVANYPRQATTSGVPNGGGATWLSPSTVVNTSALCNVIGQSWRFENIYFNNAGTTAPCVMLTVSGTGDPPVDPDASGASFEGCVFTGTDDGISSTGLPNFVQINNCTFFNFAGTGDTAISYAVGAGLKTLWQWSITNCRFENNVHNIVAALNGANVHGNTFHYIGNTVTSTSLVILTNGKNNNVMLNKFTMAESTGTATIFQGGTNDAWFNYYADGAVAGVPV